MSRCFFTCLAGGALLGGGWGSIQAHEASGFSLVIAGAALVASTLAELVVNSRRL